MYDPLGWIGPITIIGWKIAQEIVITTRDWDSPILPQYQASWEKFVSSLETLQDIKVPRSLDMEMQKSYQIHGFGDASENAYGAAVYITNRDDPQFKPRLVTSKAYISPVKIETIPRLELRAAVLTVDLTNMAAGMFEINERYYWSDSLTVLAWIDYPPKALQVGVAHSVEKIQSVSKQSQWIYCPTAENGLS